MTRTLLILFSSFQFYSCCPLGADRFDGPQSDHFDGEKFFHPWPTEKKSGWSFFKWQWSRKKAQWPKRVDINQSSLPPLKPDHLAITFINHSTVLIRSEGIHILTDPIWSERCSPFSWAGPKRVHEPGIDFENLPPIDFVLASHNHYDHMDLPTLKRLREKNPKMRILVGLGNSKYLKQYEAEGGEDLDWWDEVKINSDISITFTPAQHFSSRSLCDRNRTLWGGFVLQVKKSQIFFGGDTGFGPHFEMIQEKFGPMQLAILPIGAYEPRWFMKNAHMNPEESVQAFQILKAEFGLGVHHGTFQLTDEARDQPVKDLEKALTHRQLSREKFWVLNPGETQYLRVKSL